MESAISTERFIESFVDIEALPAGSDAQAQERSSPNLFQVICEPPELEDSTLQNVNSVKGGFQPLSVEGNTEIEGGSTLPLIVPIPLQPRQGVRNRLARHIDKAT